jgi:hypothetical protein
MTTIQRQPSYFHPLATSSAASGRLGDYLFFTQGVFGLKLANG